MSYSQEHRIATLERENTQLRARIRELEAIAAGAVVNAAERAVDLMAAQRGFNEGHTVDL